MVERAIPSGTGVRILSNVPVAMRDGVHLSTDLDLPDGAGPVATTLVRTPYDNAPLGRDSVVRSANQTVLHSAGEPSQIVLPVVPI